MQHFALKISTRGEKKKELGNRGNPNLNFYNTSFILFSTSSQFTNFFLSFQTSFGIPVKTKYFAYKYFRACVLSNVKLLQLLIHDYNEYNEKEIISRCLRCFALCVQLIFRLSLPAPIDYPIISLRAPIFRIFLRIFSSHRLNAILSSTITFKTAVEEAIG